MCIYGWKVIKLKLKGPKFESSNHFSFSQPIDVYESSRSFGVASESTDIKQSTIFNQQFDSHTHRLVLKPINSIFSFEFALIFDATT